MPLALVKTVEWNVKVPENTNDVCPRSPEFKIHFPKSGETTWNIELRYKVPDNMHKMGISLKSESKFGEAVKCKIELVERNSSNLDKKSDSERAVMLIKKSRPDRNLSGAMTIDLILIKDLLDSKDRFFLEGEILIRIEFFVESDGMNVVKYATEYLNVQQNEQLNIAPVPAVSNEFFDRFVHQQEDQVLILKFPNGQRLVTEKQLLTTSSTVFKNMIEKGVIGGTEPIDLPHYSYAKINELLRFMYTRKVNIDGNLDLALEIYETAQHYEVEGLPETCLEHISNMLDKTNVLRTLSFADRYNIPDLFNKCCGFIKIFWPELVKEPAEWNQLNNPGLMNKFYLHIFENCNWTWPA